MLREPPQTAFVFHMHVKKFSVSNLQVLRKKNQCNEKFMHIHVGNEQLMITYVNVIGLLNSVA
jgi:hypothetical protein